MPETPAYPRAFAQPLSADGARVTIFSFPLSWSLLADFPDPKSLERRKPELAMVNTPIVPVIEAPPPPPRVPEDSEHWEMVIPKMERPPLRTAPPIAKPSPVTPPGVVEKPPAAAVDQSVPLDSPSFQSVEESSLLSDYRVVVAGLEWCVAWVGGGIAVYESNQPSVPKGTIITGAELPVGMEGWMTATWPRQISILRGSMGLTDFRLEFQARIDSKALGWVFRARDFKNYYAGKLEIVKSGPQPVVALKRFAVIDGREQPVNQILLPLPVRLDTRYNVQLDALGNQFSISILGQKLDQWTDNRLAKGGVGWYGEFGEKADMQSQLSVFPLVVK